jgi:hypothetical protein
MSQDNNDGCSTLFGIGIMIFIGYWIITFISQSIECNFGHDIFWTPIGILIILILIGLFVNGIIYGAIYHSNRIIFDEIDLSITNSELDNRFDFLVILSKTVKFIVKFLGYLLRAILVIFSLPIVIGTILLKSILEIVFFIPILIGSLYFESVTEIRRSAFYNSFLYYLSPSFLLMFYSLIISIINGNGRFADILSEEMGNSNNDTVQKYHFPYYVISWLLLILPTAYYYTNIFINLIYN